MPSLYTGTVLYRSHGAPTGFWLVRAVRQGWSPANLYRNSVTLHSNPQSYPSPLRPEGLGFNPDLTLPHGGRTP